MIFFLQTIYSVFGISLRNCPATQFLCSFMSSLSSASYLRVSCTWARVSLFMALFYAQIPRLYDYLRWLGLLPCYTMFLLLCVCLTLSSGIAVGVSSFVWCGPSFLSPLLVRGAAFFVCIAICHVIRFQKLLCPWILLTMLEEYGYQKYLPCLVALVWVVTILGF